MLMFKVAELGKFEKYVPLFIALVFFATGDYLSLIRQLRFFL
jgi:hypothetical protein